MSWFWLSKHPNPISSYLSASLPSPLRSLLAELGIKTEFIFIMARMCSICYWSVCPLPPPHPTHESYLVLPPPLWSLLAGKPGLSVTDQFVPVHLLGLTCLVRSQFSPVLNWQCIQITTTEQIKRPPHTHTHTHLWPTPPPEIFY